jgi:acetyl esterase
MTASTRGVYEIAIEDVEYLRHGDKPLLARLFRPRGVGPFPLVVDLHGGAWCRSDRTSDAAINEPLARSGVVVAALDFRMPPDAPYPASLADIHYGIRWLKSRAAGLGGRPEQVALMGSSSGGHQAALLAMRPHDPRYAALPLDAPGPPVDAAVRCAILLWPVIDPLGRYHYVQGLKKAGPPYPPIVESVLPCHDAYWQTEAAMAEGSPALLLERGEPAALPPMLYVQGTEDGAHPRPHLDRFVESYRQRGGRLELALYEGESEGFINRSTSAAVDRAIERVVDFVHEQLD